MIRLDLARKSALAFFTTLTLAYLIALPETWQQQFDFYYTELLLLIVLVFMLFFARTRAVTSNARMFFTLMALAFSCWFLVRVISFVLPDQTISEFELQKDVVFLLFFAISTATVELRLDTRKDDRWILRRVAATVGSVSLVLAVFGYFAIIPVVVAAKPYASLLALHTVLDGYLAIRFLTAALQAVGRPWKSIYALFGLAFLLITWADVLSWLFRHDVLVYMPGDLLNVTWFLWYPFAFLATGVAPAGIEKSLDDTQTEVEYPNTNSLLLFGTAIPLIHAIGYAAGWLTPAARQLRDIFVATWLIAIGIILFGLYKFVHQRVNLLDKRRSVAEEKAERFEEQLNRELRLRSLGRLSSGLAHDFGNTMTALEMHATAAEKRVQLGEGAEKEFDGVRRSVQYAKKMVAQLKLFGASKVRIETGAVELGEEVKAILELIMPSLNLRERVRFHRGESKCLVLADPVMVHQVVTNYVYNAIDAFGEAGSIEVSIDERHVSGHCRSCGEILNSRFAILSVCDSGPGVSDSVADIVFEPLVTTKPTGLGSGLGLSSVHGVMHKIGGHVGLMKSSLGGANFLAYFPLNK